ncbi:MAG: hypothetical protein HY308_16645 [Gammaproteobacteria bacterium]|nr:hypothetical protein [Gammaproteobacteria bacterium]
MASIATIAADLSPASLYPQPDLRRGQFILGPSFKEGLPTWKRQQLADDLCLTTHPELSVTRVVRATSSLTLIGFMLDAADPSVSDTRILTRLLTHAGSRRQLIGATANLAGRWILIVDSDDGRYLFHDALGLRQVFHTLPATTGGVWALSQPGLAIDILRLRIDEQAQQFVDSHQFRTHSEYRWPGASSPVEGLRHLLPNHALDLRTGAVTRYWPVAPLPEIEIPQALDAIALQLDGSMRAAAARFDLALSMTAGVDSRLVLAASRAIKERLRYVTVRQGRMADTSADLWVPRRLLAKLGLRHEVVPAAASMSPEFSLAFKRSVYLAHDHYGADAEALLAHFGGGTTVAVTGSGAEIGRCSFRKDLPWSDWRTIGAADLAMLQRMNNHPYALRFFEEWLSEARDLNQVKLLDLFEWEQGHGNWLAMTQLEFDIVWRDVFTPYNCRALLQTFLSVKERYRRAPDYTLFRQATQRLWPEVLSEPINPTVPRRSRDLIRKSLRVLASLR